MRLLSVLFLCFLGFYNNVLAELSSSSCSFLRTATSITTILPEIGQLAMRYYRVSSPTVDSTTSSHHRQKRFFSTKDSGSKGSLLEQMVANAFKDMNFTKVALLILNNNETMTKVRQNIDGETIIRTAMQQIDYEKLGNSLYFAIETEFDLEYLTESFVNITHLDLIHESLIINETLPDWLIKSIHPDLNIQIIQKMFNLLKDFLRNLKTIVSDSKRLDDYLFNLIEQKVLQPLGNLVQKVKKQNPTTLDQLVEIILDNINKIVMEQFFSPTVKPIKSSGKTSKTTTTIAPSDTDTTFDDVKLLIYQCSIVLDSFGQTARTILKSFDICRRNGTSTDCVKL